MAKSGPCRGCPDRTVTCHGFCKRYQDWKKEHDDAMEWLKEKNSIPTSESARRACYDKIKRALKGYEKKRRKYE